MRHAPPLRASLALAALALAALLPAGAASAQARTVSTSTPQVLLEVVLLEVDPARVALLDGPVEARFTPPNQWAMWLATSGVPLGLRGPDVNYLLVRPMPGGLAASVFCEVIRQTEGATILAAPTILAEPDARSTLVLSRPRREPAFDDWSQPLVIEGIALRLHVRPHREDGGSLRLDVEQDGTVVGGPSATPRRAVTRSTVTVSDGRSALIRGLDIGRAVTVTDAPPVLGALPLIGPLFRRERRAVRQRALALILTATWIQNADALRAVLHQRLRAMQEWQDHVYLQSPAVDERPLPDPARTFGLVEAIRQTMAATPR